MGISLFRGLRWAFIFFLIGRASFAKAEKQNAYELPEVYAVENKLYSPQNDLSVHLGLLPLDAFYKSLSVGFSYTKNFASYWGWEIFDGEICLTQDTGLKKDLVDNFGAQPQGILMYPKYYITSNFIYTPIYAKNLWFNRSIIHSETSFLGGGGMISFNSGDTGPMLGGGMMTRFYQSSKLSYKFDARLYYHMVPGTSTKLLLNVGAAVSFEFGVEGKKDALQ